MIYLDDGVVATQGVNNAMFQSERVQRDLIKVGLVVKESKSQWVPSKHIVWLGFELDLEQSQLRVPENKLRVLHEQLLKIKGKQPMPARALANLIGKIIAMSLALGPVTRLTTRSLYAVLNCRSS